MVGVAVLLGKGGLRWDNILLASLIVIPTIIYCLFHAVSLLVQSRHFFKRWHHLAGTSYVFTVLSTLLFSYLMICQTDWGSSRMKKVIRNSSVKYSSIQIGQKAPDFSAQDQYGQSISLVNLKGKYILLDFWATWCAPCIEEIPNIEKAYEDFRGKGLVVIGINLDKNYRKFQDFIESRGTLYSEIHDDKEEIVKAYGVYAIPSIFLVNDQGIIVRKGLRGKTLSDIIRRELAN